MKKLILIILILVFIAIQVFAYTTPLRVGQILNRVFRENGSVSSTVRTEGQIWNLVATPVGSSEMAIAITLVDSSGNAMELTAGDTLLTKEYADTTYTGGGSSVWTETGDTVYVINKKVGIGTATPPYDFTVNTATGINFNIGTNRFYFGNVTPIGADYLRQYISGGNAYFIVGGGKLFRFKGGSIEYLQLGYNYNAIPSSSIYTYLGDGDTGIKHGGADTLNLLAGGLIPLTCKEEGGITKTTIQDTLQIDGYMKNENNMPLKFNVVNDTLFIITPFDTLKFIRDN